MKESIFKKFLLISASVFLIILSLSTLFLLVSNSLKQPWHQNIRAQVISEPFSKSITVTAEGKITAKPDIALVNLSVLSQSKNVKDAVKEGNEKMARIYNAVKALGVDEKDITSTSYSLYPNYEYSKDYTMKSIISYTLNQEIRVKIRDLEKIEEILDQAVEAGSNQLGQLVFDVDDPSTLKTEAREIAFKTAKEKAENMAKSAGVKLGDVMTFSEYSDSYAPRMANYAMDESESFQGSTIAPGSKDYSVNVSITYSIN